VIAKLLLVLALPAMSRPEPPGPLIRVEFEVDSATVLWNDYGSRDRPRFTGQVARSLRDSLQQDFPFVRWTSAQATADYSLTVRVQHVAAQARVYQERVTVHLVRESAAPAWAPAAVVTRLGAAGAGTAARAPACALTAAASETRRPSFSFAFMPWGTGPIRPPQRIELEALEVAKTVLDSLRAHGRNMALLAGIRLPYVVEPFYPRPNQTLLQAHVDSLQADIDHLDFEVHLSEPDGPSCNRWRISASGSGVEEARGYILGRVREIVHGGSALQLDDPDVRRLRQSAPQQDALYFRKYFRRTRPRTIQNGIVTRTGT
jgi:hypothetical protein